MQFNLLKSLMFAGAVALAAAPSTGMTQYALDYGFAIGTANYLGDIGGDQLTRQDFAADLHYGQTKLSSHVFVRYRLSRLFAIRAQLGTIYLEDYDNLSSNQGRRGRNASFRNYVNELSLRSEVNVFSRTTITRYTSRLRVGLNTYATFGVTGFLHNPQAQLDRNAAEYHFTQGHISTNPSQLDYDRWYDLRDFGTEIESYGRASLGFPLGFGASFMVNNKIRAGLEFVWNLTLTDFLDDVSTTYANPEDLNDIGLILSSPSSPISLASDQEVSPSYTSVEHYVLGNYNWSPHADVPRGNPNKNDTYGTLQVTVSKVVMGSSNFRRNNYYNKRKTVKRKPSRKPGNSRMGRGRAKF